MESSKKITALISGLTISFLLLIIACYLWIDKPLAEYFYQLGLSEYLPGLVFFTELGKAFPYVILFSVIVLFFRYIRPHAKFEARAWFLLLCVLVPNVLCLFLKVGFGRARPELWINFHQYGFYFFKFNRMYWSFPSSHTCTIIGLFTGLSFLFPSAMIYLFIPTVFIITSRIVLYQHYLSDVLTAIYLTFIILGILVYCIREQKWFLQAR